MYTRLAAMLLICGGLLGTSQAGDIFWVSALKEGEECDSGFVDLLTADGHTVETHYDDLSGTPDAAEIAAMNASDLVIVSRSTSSGDYNSPTEWNGVTAPLMLMSPWLTRSSRWKWIDTTVANIDTQEVLVATDPSHPIFNGASVVDMVANPKIPGDLGIITNDTADVGNGTVLATTQADGHVWAAHWEAGVEFYTGSGEVPAGPRLFFTLGNHEDGDLLSKYGGNNLTPEGEMLFVNAANFMVPEPSSAALMVVAMMGLVGIVRRR